jgi:predicted TIM-barrel fold metal-dependent hydrolase
MLATVAGELTLERLRDDVLRDSEIAILTCYFGVESLHHPYFGPAVATAVNRWLEHEWLDREPRLLANAVLTPQHVPAAVDEVARIGQDDRFVGVLLPARSPEMYGKQRYWPILDALAENDLALTLNVGGVGGVAPTPVGWLGSFFEDHVSATLAFQAQLMSLVFSGIFERQPNLTVVACESGWTWLPALMWRMDQEWRAVWREVPWLQGPPSTYVRRHVRLTTQPTDAPADVGDLVDVYEQLGSDELLMYASDYPHQQGSGVDELLTRLTSEQVSAITRTNAWRGYRLDGRSPIAVDAAQGL